MDIAHVRFSGEPTPAPAPVQPSPLAQPAPASSVALLQRDAPAEGLPADVLALHGLDPRAYRRRPLTRRLGPCLRALRARRERDARDRLTHPGAPGRALDALLIGVSSFFRDPSVFDTLRQQVVPALVTLGRPPRIWSVGCSMGAELYSVAILLHQAGLLTGAELLGTDCRGTAIASARRGLFDAAALAHLPLAWRRAYGHDTPDGWLVSPTLTGVTRWAVADATTAAPDGPWDLILCRNLTIYLRAGAGAALYGRLAGALARGGHLIVGQAERPPADLPLVPVGRSTYRHA